jgi:hypothetical protein
MSTQQSPYTYDSIIEMFRDTDWRKGKTKKEIKEMNRRVVLCDSTEERIYERIIRDIIAVFQEHYHVCSTARSLSYYDENLKRMVWSGINLILDNTDFEILVAVSVVLDATDVQWYIEQLKAYRRAGGRQKRCVGAVAGAIIDEEAVAIAHENGLYVIARHGKNIELLPLPEGFSAKEW